MSREDILYLKVAFNNAGLNGRQCCSTYIQKDLGQPHICIKVNGIPINNIRYADTAIIADNANNLQILLNRKRKIRVKNKYQKKKKNNNNGSQSKQHSEDQNTYKLRKHCESQNLNSWGVC